MRASFSDDVIESRRDGLERFIQIVAGHPLLQVRTISFWCNALLSSQRDADWQQGPRGVPAGEHAGLVDTALR